MPDMILCPHCMAVCKAGMRLCPTCGRPMQCTNGTHQLPIGTFLNKRYLVGCAIGGGGFGITYVGYDTLLNIKVAIKEYYPSGAANRSSTAMVYPISGGNGSSFEIGKERFLNEATILSGFIGDSGVVTLRDFFEANGTAYIIMEFLEGQDLREYLDGHGALSFDEALELVTPAIKALERVHAKGIIHGDISPSNIMRLNSGEVKILDFGTARNQGSAENYNSSMMLKPGYAPEEQFRQQGELGPWTDVYAISATIYKLITNVTPENSTDRFYKDTLIPPTKLGAKISPAQETALLKGMAVSAKNRTRTMGELLENLNRGKLSAADTAKRLLNKTAVRVGLAAAAAAVAALCFVLPQRQTDSGEISETPSATQNAQSGRIQAVTLSEDAYPFQIYSGMEEMADFTKTVLANDNKKKVEVTGCLIGNGMLCFIVEAENKSSEDMSLYSWQVEYGGKEIYFTEWIDSGQYITIEPGEKTCFGVWFSTDKMYAMGAKNINKLNLSVYLNYEGDYDTVSEAVYFPEIIRIDSSIDDSPVTIYSDDKYEVVCYGVSLREDNYSGYVLIAGRAGFNDSSYVSGSLRLNTDEVYADGAKVFGDNYYGSAYISGSSRNSDWEFYELAFDYGYSAPVDEMNVMHSGRELPKTITLSFDMGTEYNNTDIFADKELTFTIGSDGIGHAA